MPPDTAGPAGQDHIRGSAATTYTHTNPPHALLDMAGTVAVVAPGGTVLFRLTLAAAEDFADNLARQAEYGRREAKP